MFFAYILILLKALLMENTEWLLGRERLLNLKNSLHNYIEGQLQTMLRVQHKSVN